MRSKNSVPADIREVLALVDQGKLRELELLLAAGKRVRSDETSEWRFCCLRQSCERGFHTMVEVLLSSANWTQEEKDDALNFVMRERRADLVELLLAHGARPQAIDFADVCRSMDPTTIERFLKAGVDPTARNAFARALGEYKARPLLRFYKSNVKEYPALQQQLSLALACAVSEKNIRWSALLRWAGADPFLEVPSDVYGDWDFDECGGTTAAEIACSSGNAALVKVLKLRPSPERLQELLERVTWHPSVEVMKELIRGVDADVLNFGERGSCKAVETIVGRSPFYFSSTSRDQQDQAMLDCLEVLLDAGARWNPEQESIARARRELLRTSPSYVVRVLRLLLHVPNAANHALIADLCRTESIRSIISSRDKPLLADLEKLKRIEN